MSEKIRISWDDANSAQVDDKLRQQDAVQRAGQHFNQAAAAWQTNTKTAQSAALPAAPPGSGTPLYNSIFYMGLFGFVGSLLSALIWNIAYWNEAVQEPSQTALVSYVAAGMFVASALGMAESVICRNFRDAALSILGGVLIGIVAGLVGGVGGSLLMSLIRSRSPDSYVHLILGRTLAWMLFGAVVGSAPGMAMRSIKKTALGILGGSIGGLIGGAVFDPVTFSIGTAGASRLLGLCTVGTVAGIAIGVLENAAKTGWLRVTVGLIAGKQFILYRNPTYLGSSPDCEIYLFKDPAVAPRHAAIHQTPSGFEIEDLGSAAGTYVNGQAVRRTRLRNSDQLQISQTLFSFQEKPALAKRA